MPEITDRSTGRPVKPLPESFGVTWERHWRARRKVGDPLLMALVRGWFSARRRRRLPPPESDRRNAR